MCVNVYKHINICIRRYIYICTYVNMYIYILWLARTPLPVNRWRKPVNVNKETLSKVNHLIPQLFPALKAHPLVLAVAAPKSSHDLSAPNSCKTDGHVQQMVPATCDWSSPMASSSRKPSAPTAWLPEPVMLSADMHCPTAQETCEDWLLGPYWKQTES